MWKCSYCNRWNAGFSSCDGCGAPPEGPREGYLRWQLGTGALPLDLADKPKMPELRKIRD